ncbi:hypothetical protein SDC9_126753 [bioreactor metagenome]|uniref:Uncharacterized protein n=1 Tax=bioreactor metagenome TaxID=1076179 RepID=A0A645CS32_9ZZZZ
MSDRTENSICLADAVAAWIITVNEQEMVAVYIAWSVCTGQSDAQLCLSAFHLFSVCLRCDGTFLLFVDYEYCTDKIRNKTLCRTDGGAVLRYYFCKCHISKSHLFGKYDQQ